VRTRGAALAAAGNRTLGAGNTARTAPAAIHQNIKEVCTLSKRISAYIYHISGNSMADLKFKFEEIFQY
jgi:hypothetical protein